MGEKVYRRLQDIPDPDSIDILDVFRRAEDLDPHLPDILELKPKVFITLCHCQQHVEKLAGSMETLPFSYAACGPSVMAMHKRSLDLSILCRWSGYSLGYLTGAPCLIGYSAHQQPMY